MSNQTYRELMAAFLVDGATCEAAWLIERTAVAAEGWHVSSVFPLSLSYSTLSFYLQEVARLQTNNGQFEGIRLSMIIGERRVLIDAYIIFSGPKKGKRRGH
jgi:hypothetical protein